MIQAHSAGVNSGFGGDDKWGPKPNQPADYRCRKQHFAGARDFLQCLEFGIVRIRIAFKTKTLANPRVLTQNRKEAKIESGYEIPFTVTSIANGGSSTNTELKKPSWG